MNKIFGASWTTSLTGLLGGLAIALWPIIQSAVNTQMQGVKIDWQSVLIGAVVAVAGYFAKAHNVSNSPTPIAVAQEVIPVTAATTAAAPVEMAKPVITK